MRQHDAARVAGAAARELDERGRGRIDRLPASPPAAAGGAGRRAASSAAARPQHARTRVAAPSSSTSAANASETTSVRASRRCAVRRSSIDERADVVQAVGQPDEDRHGADRPQRRRASSPRRRPRRSSSRTWSPGATPARAQPGSGAGRAVAVLRPRPADPLAAGVVKEAGLAGRLLGAGEQQLADRRDAQPRASSRRSSSIACSVAVTRSCARSRRSSSSRAPASDAQAGSARRCAGGSSPGTAARAARSRPCRTRARPAGRRARTRAATSGSRR